MFKKVLQSLTKSFGKTTEASKPAPKQAEVTPSPKSPTGAEVKQESLLKKIAAPPAMPPRGQQSPEELCGIEARMNKDQIRDRLKLLYRRHNRAASSLDNKTRTEADAMLDAIVAVREKTFGEI